MVLLGGGRGGKVGDSKSGWVVKEGVRFWRIRVAMFVDDGR